MRLIFFRVDCSLLEKVDPHTSITMGVNCSKRSSRVILESERQPNVSAINDASADKTTINAPKLVATSDAPKKTNGEPNEPPLELDAAADSAQTSEPANSSLENTNERSMESHTKATSETKMNRIMMGEIQPHFWIGGIGALKEIHKSDRSWKIVSIVHAPNLVQFCRDSVNILREAGRIHQHLLWPMADQNESPLLCERLDEVLCFMDDHSSSEHPLLVHCAFGVSRSVSVCAAWLISRQGLSLSKALDTIRVARPEASPNMGFIASLRALEQSGGSVKQALERQHRQRRDRIGRTNETVPSESKDASS